ncbi:hypothetical protein J1N35_041908 [Gossypium stocksii]|uniref:RNase H type-1 domain-containing protein n=1 Tax=Gossypium stocksii TaxID=47602 RepID=A0A9D3ZJ25_9ROSI|nr:hypothetical protein J1N35_041908 [Gossypium stocksii]
MRLHGWRLVILTLSFLLSKNKGVEIRGKIKGLGNNCACGFCRHECEDVLHVLRDCFATRSIWDNIISAEQRIRFYSDSLHTWLLINLNNHCSISFDEDYSWSYEEIIKGSYSWAKQYSLALNATLHKTQSHPYLLHTSSNWVSLKSDGSVRPNEGFATVGGFVSDHNDEWIIGYCKYLGNCSVFEAELWGILDGLKIILDRSFKRALIQTDSIEAVNVIQESSIGSSNSALVRRILLILKMFEKYRIQHISREENLVADRSAKSAHSKILGLILIEDPLVKI